MAKKTYQQKKAEAIDEAIEWQNNFEKRNYSWGEIAYVSNHFEKLARRYGLVREFKENGII